jgi:hypothetical protein
VIGIFDLVAGTPLAWLLVRVCVIALFVILVTLLAERLGPFLGAMVASLPLYTGPIYVMLALEHDAAYLAAATIGSIAICGATPVYLLAYCVLARTRGLLASLAGALGAWAGCAALVQANQWTLIEAVVFVVPIYAVSVALARSFTRGVAVSRTERRWTDLPLRALVVAVAAGLVIWLSSQVPPQLTGVLSVIPVLISSLVVILHPRIGGPATAALFAHTLGGLVGMVLGFVLINLTLAVIGVWAALAAGLAVTVAWNLLLILTSRLRGGATCRSQAPQRRRAGAAHGPPPPRRPTAR